MSPRWPETGDYRHQSVLRNKQKMWGVPGDEEAYTKIITVDTRGRRKYGREGKDGDDSPDLEQISQIRGKETP